MMLDESKDRLIGAWIEAFDGERPELDRVRIRTRVLAAFESTQPRRLAARCAYAGLAAAAVVAVTLGVTKLSWWGAPTFTVAGQHGEVGEWLATNETEQLPLDFSEGTHVAIDAGSRARVEEVSRHGARVVIERGSLSAHVTHRRDAAWHFGAGPFDVLVVGTSLSVNWDPAQGMFELGVQRGSVVVSGPLIKTSQEVRAGERCRVDLTRHAMQLDEVAKAAPPPPDMNLLPQPEAPAVPDTGETSLPGAANHGAVPLVGSAWLALAKDGKYRDAVGAAERNGLARIYQTASADDLLELARSARLAGRADVEHDALLACRQHYGGQPSAAKAAYLLGRAAAPKEAAQWFETYLREQPSGMLSREAAGRLIESHQRAGNVAGARDAATRYLASYPDGPQAAIARRVLAAGHDGG
jgi:TolA-binding protein